MTIHVINYLWSHKSQSLFKKSSFIIFNNNSSNVSIKKWSVKKFQASGSLHKRKIDFKLLMCEFLFNLYIQSYNLRQVQWDMWQFNFRSWVGLYVEHKDLLPWFLGRDKIHSMVQQLNLFLQGNCTKVNIKVLRFSFYLSDLKWTVLAKSLVQQTWIFLKLDRNYLIELKWKKFGLSVRDKNLAEIIIKLS